jgi:hypothetical protein
MGWQVNVDHLAPGVHPGVGPTGAGERGWLGQPKGSGKDRGQGPGHGRLARLGREPPERCAVVCDNQAPANGRFLVGCRHCRH